MTTRRCFFLAIALGACLAGTVARAEDAPASAPVPTSEVKEFKLDGNQVLLPGEGPGWKLLDKSTGKEKAIILPAFHPELSYPVVQGNRMAYVGRTQNKGKQQLGCITFDLARGKVLNRQVSSLFAREGQVIESPHLGETENGVTCNLSGDRCTGKNLENCSAATETINLDFEPGSLAKKDLKSAKASRKSAHGKTRGGKTKGKAGAKAGKKTAAGKHGAAAKVKAKAGKAGKATASHTSSKKATHR